MDAGDRKEKEISKCKRTLSINLAFFSSFHRMFLSKSMQQKDFLNLHDLQSFFRGVLECFLLLSTDVRKFPVLPQSKRVQVSTFVGVASKEVEGRAASKERKIELPRLLGMRYSRVEKKKKEAKVFLSKSQAFFGYRE